MLTFAARSAERRRPADAPLSGPAKAGGMLIEIELSLAALDHLVALRWLAPAKRHDADAVAAAIIRSFEVLAAGVWATKGALGKA